MPRRGLSMVEVVLALGILVVIVGLLLPALTWQRAKSGFTRQRNNLQQIALACHNYNDADQGKLPQLVDVGEGTPTGGGMQSLFFNILPYIDQDNIYKTFNKARPNTYYNSVDGAAMTIVTTYLNPVDETAIGGLVVKATSVVPDGPDGVARSFTGTYATTSFAANGLIPWQDAGIPRTFKDGTSNTILFAERPQACTDAAGRTIYNLWGYGTYGPSTPAFALLTPDDPAGLLSTGQIVAALPLPAKWSSAMMPVRIGRASAASQPSPVARSFQVGIKANGPCDPRIAGSPHGAMLVALGDGSVRSLDPKMSDWTYWAALTPDGNETPYTDW
jgi:type II secretory pathway pseudopilin PulG